MWIKIFENNFTSKNIVFIEKLYLAKDKNYHKCLSQKKNMKQKRNIFLNEDILILEKNKTNGHHEILENLIIIHRDKSLKGLIDNFSNQEISNLAGLFLLELENSIYKIENI